MDLRPRLAPQGTGRRFVSSLTSHSLFSTALLRRVAWYGVTDWYTRLNALLSAGPPPEPRLQVNAALARYQIVPVKVELARSGENKPLRAEHEFTWRLSKDDQERIDDACASLAAYRPVENEEFLQGQRAANSQE